MAWQENRLLWPEFIKLNNPWATVKDIDEATC